MIELAKIGRVTAVIGAASQLVGLGWDAVLHRVDPGLAEREGIFTLTNPGHLLFAGGLALVVGGLGLWLVSAGSRGSRALRFGSLALLILLSGSSVALAGSSEGGLTGHHHDQAAGDLHVHDDAAVHAADMHAAVTPNEPDGGHSHATPAQVAAQTAAGHERVLTADDLANSDAQSRHQHAADIPITSGELTTLNAQLVAARAGTEKYQDVRVALADGYRQVTQDLPGIASHFISPANVIDGVFDPAKPEILLYTKIDGQWKLAGVSYLAPFTGSETPPEGFAGPLDVWHYHTDLCFKGQSVISATKSAAECRAAGGAFTKNTGWMAHLWLYMEGPEGLFAHENSLLKGGGAVLTKAEIAAMQ